MPELVKLLGRLGEEATPGFSDSMLANRAIVQYNVLHPNNYINLVQQSGQPTKMSVVIGGRAKHVECNDADFPSVTCNLINEVLDSLKGSA